MSSLPEQPVCKDGKRLIPGAVGQLELQAAYPQGCPAAGEPLAIICHPHPLYGGSMTNKVVHMLASSFAELGMASFRFNFRGVGRSEGEFAHAEGEVDDLLAVVEWVRQRHPDSPLWLAGFSFGAFVAIKGHVAAAAERLLLVAPPVSMYPFEDIPEVEVPWLVLQGGEDEVISAEAVRHWVEVRHNRPELVWFDGVSHFFHGKLNLIREAVTTRWGG